MESALVIAFECIFGCAARDLPVILRDTKFLVSLTADSHTIVATSTACADEFFETKFG